MPQSASNAKLNQKLDLYYSVALSRGSLTLSQFVYTAGIDKLLLDSTHEEFANVCGKLAYAVFASNPGLTFDVARLSQFNSDRVDKKDISKINKTIRAIKKVMPLTYRHMNKDSMYVVGYDSAGFANNAYQTS